VALLRYCTLRRRRGCLQVRLVCCRAGVVGYHCNTPRLRLGTPPSTLILLLLVCSSATCTTSSTMASTTTHSPQSFTVSPGCRPGHTAYVIPTPLLFALRPPSHATPSHSLLSSLRAAPRIPSCRYGSTRTHCTRNVRRERVGTGCECNGRYCTGD
jgi:hypothetical protein